MHTFKAKNTSFIYNSDLSGEIEIVQDNNSEHDNEHPEKDVVTGIVIPADDLLEFVASLMQNKMVRDAENMKSKKIIKKYFK